MGNEFKGFKLRCWICQKEIRVLEDYYCDGLCLRCFIKSHSLTEKEENILKLRINKNNYIKKEKERRIEEIMKKN